jgi:phosphopantetheinyl transferase (holo-ACP synthase)
MSVTVDVVDLRRIERLHAEAGAVLERRLLHPLERERLATPHRLAAALAIKEAWIKSGSGRPGGWTFDRAAFVPAHEQAPPDAVEGLVGRFVDDLGVTAVEVGVVYGDPRDRGRWAWYGIHDHWLISAVLA